MPEMNQQLSLFDILEDTPREINKMGKQVIKGVVDPGTVLPPDTLLVLSNTSTLEQFVQLAAGLKGIQGEEPLLRISVGWRANVYAASAHNRLFVSDKRPRSVMNCLELPSTQKDLSTTLIYVDDNGVPWSNKLELHFNAPLYISWQATQDYANGHAIDFDRPIMLEKMVFSKWKVFAKYPEPGSYMLLNNQLDLWDILERTNPYAMETAKQYDCSNPLLFFTCPQLEQLVKAGYDFAENGIRGFWRQTKDIDAFNRLTQPGTKLKNIFKTSKDVYTTLRGETELEIWDVYRKMAKSGKLTKETIEQAYWSHFDADDLKTVNSILNRKYEGKPVFTWHTLMNFLQRLDTFQAISAREAFPLLNDYLTMCEQLEIKPRIDSDSLKREHDVTARTIREKKNEILEKKMENACEYLSENDYTEDIFFIRGIRNHADLIDEAKQQRNCVGSYGQRIINHQSLIYVMRETAHPDRSLITVEINPECDRIRQKYLAFNQPITDGKQNEFLERWMGLIQEKKKQHFHSIQEMLGANCPKVQGQKTENVQTEPDLMQQLQKKAEELEYDYLLEDSDYELIAEWMDDYREDYTHLDEAITHCVEDYVAGHNAYVMGG
ncbi:MAG: PcfJ domain-containing protein [Clostridiales bacterium]|nr:PcfJ domain-containing protein [Clostridiales bacterium]